MYTVDVIATQALRLAEHRAANRRWTQKLRNLSGFFHTPWVHAAARAVAVRCAQQTHHQLAREPLPAMKVLIACCSLLCSYLAGIMTVDGTCTYPYKSAVVNPWSSLIFEVREGQGRGQALVPLLTTAFQ
jgi:hypothetical protein